MLTAIILCRKNSRRLKKKHFFRIGKLTLIENLIQCINQNKEINEIYLATGPKKNNYIFEKKLKKKYSYINYYYHVNENNVTERVTYLSRKIKNKNFVLISGDCPLIDNEFINLSNQFLLKKNYDFISLKNSNIEGHAVYSKKIWEKINKLSDLKDFKEHPGLVTKFKRDHFYKNLIDVTKSKKFEKFKSKKKVRMSVDTRSDLNFFNQAYLHLKYLKKKFNYKNVKNLENIFKENNSHVFQQLPFSKKIKVIIITSKSYKIGLGHLKRSQSLKREIEESTNFEVKLFIIKNMKDLNKISKIKDLNLVIDLPNHLIKKIYYKFHPKNSIFVDNTLKFKNVLNIVPGIISPNKNCLSGKKYLIINRDIDLINNKKKIVKEKYNIVIPGGVSKVPKKILDFCINNKKEKFLFVINKKNNKENLKILKQNKIEFLQNPRNLFELIKASKRQLIRHGVLTYEILAMKMKPFIWTFDENKKRNDDIRYLKKKGYANIFNEVNFFKISNLISKKKKIDVGAQGFLKKVIELTKNK